MPTRLIALSILLTAAMPGGAQAQRASPQTVACHGEATQRYIADFRQVGTPRKDHDGFPIVVTTFENRHSRYEEYLAECLGRWKRDRTRTP